MIWGEHFLLDNHVLHMVSGKALDKDRKGETVSTHLNQVCDNQGKAKETTILQGIDGN